MPELSDIIGQDSAVAQLQRAMASGRLPHALLFAGPDGVGRRSTAIALAKTLLCENPVTLDETPTNERSESAGTESNSESLSAGAPFRQACGACADCRMFEAESHPDFHLVRKELAKFHEDPAVRSRKMQALGIDVIRSFLIAPAGLSPARKRGKVFVVLEAERMSPEAQNSLLKTLEEPPEGVTIILICRRAEQLLATTRSRCALVRFGPLPRKFVIDRLVADGVARREAEFWSAFTEGSIGRASDLSSRGIYEIKRELVGRIASLPPAGDAALGEHLAKLAETLAAQAVKQAKKADGGDMSMTLARRETSILLQLIAGAYRDAIRFACGQRRPAELANADQHEAIETLAARMDIRQLTDVIEQLSEYERLLWRNVSPKTLWDNVVITCASAAPLRVGSQ